MSGFEMAATKPRQGASAVTTIRINGRDVVVVTLPVKRGPRG
jgi:hypothetical protein